MFSTAQRAAQDLEDVSSTCDCGETMLTEDMLPTEHGQFACSETCRTEIDGPED